MERQQMTVARTRRGIQNQDQCFRDTLGREVRKVSAKHDIHYIPQQLDTQSMKCMQPNRATEQSQIWRDTVAESYRASVRMLRAPRFKSRPHSCDKCIA